MTDPSTIIAPSRFGPLNPQDWPQMDNRVPRAMAAGMPAIEVTNAERARQESFTLSTTFTLPLTIVRGQVLTQIIQTDQDGDFWCDQIYCVGWGLQLNPGSVSVPANPVASTVDIVDLRTARALTFPLASTPTQLFTNMTIFSDDPGFDPGALPYPAGFRSTSTIAQPFCFTRAGGIQITLTLAAAWAAVAGPNLVDFAFGGWKEYAHAS